MESNILKRKNLETIYFEYKDKYRRNLKVNVQYVDDEICYLNTNSNDTFEKPPKNNPANVLVCTKTGVYKGQTKIINTSVTFAKIIFEVKVPKKWEYIQNRNSIRKPAELPFNIKYNDGYEIAGKTVDVSLGGFAFLLPDTFSSIYEKLEGKAVLNLSHEIGDINADVKFLRRNIIDDKIRYVYRFTNIDSSSRNLLGIFLNMSED